MSMQLTLRPYVTAGIALVGASVIAVSPIVPSHADVHLPAVNLTASIDNPIEVFAPVVNAAGSWITNTIQSEIANPFPILQQIARNQITTAAGVLEAVQAGAKGVGELAAGLPAALQAAGAKLAVGDVNGAIDAIISSGLNPIIGLISGVWTPMQAVLQRPFAVGQALVPALFDAALSLTLGAVLSTVGIGFDTGVTPFIQQIVKSTQAVLTAVTTLNPINVLNAIQHGFADVALNMITQLDSFTTGTIPFIRDTIVRALQAPNPAVQMAAISAGAAAAETAAPELTAPVTETGGSATSPEGTSITVNETKSLETTPVKVVKEETTEATAVETVPVDTAVVDVPEAETVSTAVETAETPAKDTAVTETEATAVKVTTGSTTVTRDSLKAEPGKSGLASGTATGTGNESATKAETTDTTSVSVTKDASSATSSSASTSAGSDSGSGSDSNGSSDSD